MKDFAGRIRPAVTHLLKPR